MTTTTDTSDVLANGLAALDFSQRLMDGLCEDIPEEHATHQPVPGANHMVWQIGHMAWTDDYFLSKLLGGQSALPESWTKLFGMGSEPQADASIYPPLAEMRARRAERRGALLEWYRAQADAKLAEPMPEDYQTFAPNFGALMSSLAAHEAMHAGQVTLIRKSLSMPRKLG
jgi:uncharacterized damage-inducible protein DinB